MPACLQVFKSFKEIASTSGGKSQERKRGMIVKLLAAAKQEEAGYVMRALQVRCAVVPVVPGCFRAGHAAADACGWVAVCAQLTLRRSDRRAGQIRRQNSAGR